MKPQKFFNALGIVWQHLRQSAVIFQYSNRAISLVWSTSHSLTLIFAGLTLAAGLFPAVIAYVGKLIKDGIVVEAGTHEKLLEAVMRDSFRCKQLDISR